MKIRGRIYRDGRFTPGTMEIADGKIAAIRGECDGASDAVLDAGDGYVVPGLIDLHFHGAMGEDICDGSEEALRTIARFEASEGVTAICPAMLTLPVGHLKDVLRMAARMRGELRESADTADLVGLNMEGPFISPVKKGAQNGDYILPCDAALCREFHEASEGLLKIIGLAPEESAAFEDYIREVSPFVRVSLAHTNADYDTALRAIRAGARHAVHLCNAMPEMTHRAPGVIGAVLDSPAVYGELICDGNHVHPSMVRALFTAMGSRICLISDSLRAAGMGDGIIDLGGQDVRVEGTRATLVDGGNLAGSVTPLTKCLAIAVREMGVPLEAAVRAATENPAKVLGIEDEYGYLAEGRRADILVLDGNLKKAAVFKDGVRIA